MSLGALRGPTVLWVGASVMSFVFLGLVIANVEWNGLVTMASDIDPTWLAAGLSLFLVEGFCTAMRIRVFTPGNHSLGTCLRLNAWYVLMVVVLPARLGELAGIVLFRRYLGLNAGAATINVIAQRMLDAGVLGGVFLVIAVVSPAWSGGITNSLLVLAVVGMITVVMVQLPAMLALAARPLTARRRR